MGSSSAALTSSLLPGCTTELQEAWTDTDTFVLYNQEFVSLMKS